jgi:Ca-activated chloride channel homolog
MTVFGDFHFIRPTWLSLLPVVAWLWWWQRRLRDPLRGWRAMMDPQLLAALTVGTHNGARWQGMTLLAGWLLAIVALAGPTWRPGPSPLADDPVPVMVVLKAGETMDLADLSPSRMERAQLKIVDFAGARKGQPLGLIAYAGSSHLVLPPTRDTSVVASMAAEISPVIMPKNGDNTASSVELAISTLGDVAGFILVVTDTVAPRNISQLQQIGKTRHAPIRFLAIARPGTPELDAIKIAASAVGGTVTLMTADSTDIDALVKQTANAPISVAAADQETRWAEVGWWLVPVLALLSLAGFRRVENAESGEAAV